MVGVRHFDTHHLESAADAEHGGTLAMGTDNGLRTTIAAQFVEVVQGGFRSWQNDDVGFLEVFHVVRIEKMYARVAFQSVEIRIIGKMAQHDNRHRHL